MTPSQGCSALPWTSNPNKGEYPPCYLNTNWAAMVTAQGLANGSANYIELGQAGNRRIR